MTVIIKGKLVDPKSPLVCVPVTDESASDIINHAASLVEAGVEMIEWRADFFDSLSDRDAVKEVLNKLREITRETILLATIRTKKQGGECTMTPGELKSVLIEMAQSHCADLIDVEYFTFEEPARLIKKLQERGALVVLSHHDFNETPKRDVMRSLLSNMTEVDADIVKLAVMPNSMQDVSNLFSVTSWFSNEYASIPLITMSMGKMGGISRVGGFCFGSCVTFAADGERASAPGQLSYSDTKTIIELLK